MSSKAASDQQCGISTNLCSSFMLCIRFRNGTVNYSDNHLKHRIFNNNVASERFKILTHLIVLGYNKWTEVITSLRKHRWEPKQPRRKPRSNEGRVVPGKENILANFSTTSKVAAATEPDLNKGLIHWFATQSLKSSFSRSRLI
ncbi:hypothetical protein F2P81_008926 [Scophthalmus maximus]|uniref:Uncharacterized protein n=1 Tax=Scophthalmus maximus TaxID=52904 RepID=A0A6A4T8F7_SCOMX|nr:hypothetical protein F2P81_008926 [Scophthalmus maximus]